MHVKMHAALMCNPKRIAGQTSRKLTCDITCISRVARTRPYPPPPARGGGGDATHDFRVGGALRWT